MIGFLQMALILIFPFSASPVFATQNYEGRWTENPAWCNNTGGTDEMPITITSRLIETFASSCRVLSVSRKAVKWRIHTSCLDEGQDTKEPRVSHTFFLQVDGDKLTLRNGTSLIKLTRCP